MQPIRRWSKGNAEKFNVLVNCFVSANLGVVMDPGGTSIVVGVERQDFDSSRTTYNCGALGQESLVEKWDGEQPTCPRRQLPYLGTERILELPQ